MPKGKILPENRTAVHIPPPAKAERTKQRLYAFIVSLRHIIGKPAAGSICCRLERLPISQKNAANPVCANASPASRQNGGTGLIPSATRSMNNQITSSPTLWAGGGNAWSSSVSSSKERRTSAAARFACICSGRPVRGMANTPSWASTKARST